MNLVERAEPHLPGLVRLRRHLHAVPEVGLRLPRTQAALLDALSGLGLAIRTGSACTSVVAVVEGQLPGETVLLRADMDALPIGEDSGEPFASDNGCMHACGHDLHMAGLVGAARLLTEVRSQLRGRVVLMFQPGEEGHDGAQVMLDEGLLKTTATPPVAAYALHVGPGRAGTMWTRPGAILAGMGTLRITVRGAGGHASAPHDTLDPVPVLAEIVLALQSHVTRRHRVFDPVVLSVTRLQAGDAVNVIPGSATLEASVRALSADAVGQLRTQVQDLASHIARAHGMEAGSVFADHYPVTCNDPAETEFAVRTASRVLGRNAVDPAHPALMGSEDFSKVLARVPGALVFMGTTPPDLDPATAPGVHSPQARFTDRTLPLHAALLAQLAFDRLASGS
ncbi:MULTISPECIES: M20 family metallopeptidase [Amycolatopsis]|uniref:Hippurate hydrolase n=1 Tax=Amycolatopsis rubida TaxID=112413 RepID=A0A1I5ZFH4_9PSEU|nr:MULTISPECIES: M20 family metallopeptidase [Amycolatopsis]OAP25499.1 putative hydrolase YxeP [Amycolatopsis sp. M39]SFQ55279.1 hippurate hydrolase [Amycolatopsis rubida]